MNTNNRPAAIVLINLAFAVLFAFAAYSVLLEVISSVESGDLVVAFVCLLPAALMVFLSVASLNAVVEDR
jgi:uncharacterized membrane protein